jgi:hypothetical protein
MKGGIVERTDAAIARQQCNKHPSRATDADTTIEDDAFSMQPVPRLHNEEQLDKPVSGR